MTPPRFDNLLITCEHASNATGKWDAAFRGKRNVLKTHRAWDPGAAVLALQLQNELEVIAQFGHFTRLLIDLNRAEGSGALFSEFTPESARAELLTYHRRWRATLLDYTQLDSGPLLHVSCHSFTPVWKDNERRVDIGILFDPQRPRESATAVAWQRSLQAALPGMRIRRNNPYRGVSDGTTSWLRRQHSRRVYAGIEIELNQSFAARPPAEWAHVRAALTTTIQHSLA